MDNPVPISWAEVRKALQNIWGYEDFRPPQGDIIHNLLVKKDTLVIMPTGGGKSICFQLPALLQAGLTIVVTPLVALMENQVQDLRQRNLKAALLHSELPSAQRRLILQALERQQLKLLYLSPETLLSSPVWERLCQPQLVINSLIVDEAHCLVHWGETFRPAYRRLGAVRLALLKTKPLGTKIVLAAFTATADPLAQETVLKTLQLEDPVIFRTSPYCSNINPCVCIAWTPHSRKQKLLNFLHNKKQQSGLIYVRTRRDSESLATWLQQLGYITTSYHGGLEAGERRNIESQWLNGKIPFVICTSAFGMGINKSDVRWVVHFHTPLLISEYVQEIGRAGRDGRQATALLLMSEPTGWLDPEDQQRRQFFENQMRSQQYSAQQLMKKLPKTGEVKAIEQQFTDGSLALAILNSHGYVRWLGPFHYQTVSGVRIQPPKEVPAVKQMQRYLTTRQCRWRFLLTAFGFEPEINHWFCGHCDNCNSGMVY